MASKTCGLWNCDRPHHCKGVCKYHYERYHRTGLYEPLSDYERFHQYVDTNGPLVDPRIGSCWTWRGSKANGDRYGTFHLNGRSRSAHTVSWEFANGRDFPEGMEGDHLCYNIHCVRPSHIEPVTPEVNRYRKRQQAS